MWVVAEVEGEVRLGWEQGLVHTPGQQHMGAPTDVAASCKAMLGKARYKHTHATFM